MRTLSSDGVGSIEKDRMRRTLSYGAAVTVLSIALYSLCKEPSGFFADKLSGFWTSAQLPASKGINMTCSVDSARRCNASFDIIDFPVQELSMRFLSSQAAEWVAVEPVGEDGWVLLIYLKGRLMVRALSHSNVSMISFGKRLTGERVTTWWDRKGRYVCAIFLVIIVFKWVQLKCFSARHVKYHKRLYRGLLQKSDTRKKRD
ncbi:hypothetical protein DQ04_00401010 [Trypanosoma grayi]|uniref:hypothetical protein n=1 Tax=Trypanosoma grayi TaxID=71804 RepID=UPI0004F47385|nr:hypothetical protein DQ04_00401010 [Trypanosoma grayi]KEG14561.1 hypothetical protein DQ04_00401010 [Trypanosoma grayi]